MLLTLKGTPFIYQGDELGMTNYPFTKIEEFDDIQVKNAWKAEVLTGQASIGEYIAHLLNTSAITPVRPCSGRLRHVVSRTGAKSWLAVNPNYKENQCQTSSGGSELDFMITSRE